MARRGHHLIREYSVDPFEIHRVGEIMEKNPPTIPATMTVKELADRGYGHQESRKARNNRKVVWFVAKRVQSGQIGSSRVADPTGHSS